MSAAPRTLPEVSAAPEREAADGDARALVIQKGRVFSYRVYDMADEIALERAEAQVRNRMGRRRLRLPREGAEVLVFAAPPLDVELGARNIPLPKSGRTVRAELTARMFDYGAVSVRFDVTVAPGTSVHDLLPLCDELYDTDELDSLGRREVEELVASLGSAVIGRHDWRQTESYTVVFVEQLEGMRSATELRRSHVVAKLLLGEATEKSLSEDERDDVLRHKHSYCEDDLVIIDWNSAFVLEPSGNADIPEILEFATAQLLELRYYDDSLDAELGHIYDEFAEARRRPTRIVWSPYGSLARDVLRRLVELTEFTERVDNALKVVGDFYLAKVYQSAVRRFRIPEWRQSVESKQALVARAYELMKGEVDIRRSQALEIVVIVLILFELVAVLRGR